MPKVSFITVNEKTSPHSIRHLMAGIEAAHLPFDFEYLAVDDAASFVLHPTCGEYILFLHAELTIFSGEIDAWVSWMDEHPDVGISSPHILYPDGTDFTRDVHGAAMCIRRSVLEKIGPVDPRFARYFWDADLCRRAREAGFHVTVTPSARVVRYVGHDRRWTWAYLKDAVRYVWKYRVHLFTWPTKSDPIF